jgi:guanylate kinase
LQRPLFLFIKPTSEEALEARLRGRGTEDEEAVAKRMATAKTELAFEASADGKKIFNRVIVNDNLDVAYTEFKAAICEAHGL